MEDRQIVALFEERSPQAVEAALGSYGLLLQQLCGNILEDDRDTEECVNDTMLALWNTIPPEKPRSLTAYICRIARNLALKKRRDREAAKRDCRLSVSLEQLKNTLPAPSMEEAWDAVQLAQAIDRFLAAQDTRDRVLFFRYHWFGDELRAAATVVGMSENTASKRLQRLRLRLRGYLEQEGFFHE